MFKNLPLLLSFLVISGLSSFAQPSISLNVFSSGFTKPVDIKHANDDRIFVVEQDGRIKIMNQAGVVNATLFLNIDPIVKSTGNEQGLLGLAFHPDYQNNGYFYLNYTNNSGNTVISRWSVSAGDPDIANVLSETILLTISQPYSNHNGGHLDFGPDGYLYIGMGDGGSGGDPGNRAQNGNELLGKMLRLDVDNGLPYAIPADNPFLGNALVRDEIWAIGVRNPWKWSFDDMTGDLWIGDVGQDTWEEVDFQPANSPGGENYGWRCYEGNATYNTGGCGPIGNYQFPIHTHANNGPTGCSITGGYVYRGAQLGGLFGYYVHTDYCSGIIWATEPDSIGGWNTYTLSNLADYEYVGFGEDQYRELYVAGLSSGTIWKISEANCQPTAYIYSPDTVYLCGNDTAWLNTPYGQDLNYQWYDNGVPLAGDTTFQLAITSPGTYSVEVTNMQPCSTLSNAIVVENASIPSVSLSPGDTVYCTLDGDVTLVGSPGGGFYSGPGVTGNQFSPAFAGPGIHAVVYTYTSPEGCEATDTMWADVQICTGINAQFRAGGLKIYPNPNSGQFEASFTLLQTGEFRISISDLSGREVFSQKSVLNSGDHHLSFDLGTKAGQGVYFVRFEGENFNLVRKLLLN